jgi:YD repeat-containing protein
MAMECLTPTRYKAIIGEDPAQRGRNAGGRCSGLKGGCVMKITYDAEVDALYIQFLETTVTTEHLAEGIAADYDAEGRLAGIEILDALKRFGGPQTLRQVILEDVGLVRA